MAENGSVSITGKTFDHKDDLKAIGGRWDVDNKAYVFTAAKAQAAIELATKHGLHVNGKKMQKPARTEKTLAPVGSIVQAVVSLPGEKVQTIDTPFGQIATRKIGVRLLKGEHLYSMPGKSGLFPDHKGFERLAEAAGISVVLPFHQRIVRKDGSVMDNAPNPYCITDDDGTLRAIHVYAVAHGFTSTGKYEFSQASIYYALDSYFKTVIIKKVKECKTAGEFCHRSTWDDLKGEARHHRAWFPLQGDMGVMLYLDSEEVQDIFTTIEDKRQKAERSAATIAKRVAHSHHPAIAIKNVENYLGEDGECAVVPVTQVIHNSGEVVGLGFAALAGRFDQVPGFEVNAEPTIIDGPSELFDTSQEVPSREEAEDITDVDFTDNGAPSEPTDEQVQAHRNKLLEQVRVYKDRSHYMDTIKPIAKERGFKNISEADANGLTEVLAALGEAEGQEVKTDGN